MRRSSPTTLPPLVCQRPVPKRKKRRSGHARDGLERLISAGDVNASAFRTRKSAETAALHLCRSSRPARSPQHAHAAHAHAHVDPRNRKTPPQPPETSPGDLSLAVTWMRAPPSMGSRRRRGRPPHPPPAADRQREPPPEQRQRRRPAPRGRRLSPLSVRPRRQPPPVAAFRRPARTSRTVEGGTCCCGSSSTDVPIEDLGFVSRRAEVALVLLGEGIRVAGHLLGEGVDELRGAVGRRHAVAVLPQWSRRRRRPAPRARGGRRGGRGRSGSSSSFGPGSRKAQRSSSEQLAT